MFAVLKQKSAFIIPSNMAIGVGTLRLIPAHTCSFMGCLGWGFSVADSPFLPVRVPSVAI